MRPNEGELDDEIRGQRKAAAQLHVRAVDGGRGVLEMKDDAILLVEAADEVAAAIPQQGGPAICIQHSQVPPVTGDEEVGRR